MPVASQGDSSTAWLDLGMSAARVRDALRGVELSSTDIKELLGREAGYKNRRFVINLLEQMLADQA